MDHTPLLTASCFRRSGKVTTVLHGKQHLGIGNDNEIFEGDYRGRHKGPVNKHTEVNQTSLEPSNAAVLSYSQLKADSESALSGL